MKPWTDKEREFIAHEAKDGSLTVQQIARRLGRSYSSVSAMMREMGLKIAYRPLFWTAERDAKLTEMYAAGASRREICRAMNITLGSMESRATALGLKRPKADFEPKERGPHCSVCFINAENMAGCPRPDCAHYAAPLDPGPQTLAGVGSAML